MLLIAVLWEEETEFSLVFFRFHPISGFIDRILRMGKVWTEYLQPFAGLSIHTYVTHWHIYFMCFMWRQSGKKTNFFLLLSRSLWVHPHRAGLISKDIQADLYIQFEWIQGRLLWETDQMGKSLDVWLLGREMVWMLFYFSRHKWKVEVLLTHFPHLGWSQAEADSWSQEGEGQQGHRGWRGLHRRSRASWQSTPWGS